MQGVWRFTQFMSLLLIGACLVGLLVLGPALIWGLNPITGTYGVVAILGCLVAATWDNSASPRAN